VTVYRVEYKVFYLDGLAIWKHYQTYSNKFEAMLIARWLRWNDNPTRIKEETIMAPHGRELREEQ
jgi:hypothetical protein